MRYFNGLLRTVLITALISFASCSGSGHQDEKQDSETNRTASNDDDGFESIFDGTLNDWEGDSTYWSARDGVLIGQITPTTLLKTNSFIIWNGGSLKDFELKADFKITEAGNSGINYRSEKVADVPNALRGYQADIDGKNNYTGQNYEERGRTTLAYRGEIVEVRGVPDENNSQNIREHVKNNAWTMRDVEGSLGSRDSLGNLIKVNDWNTCHIIANGNRLQHYVNGILMSDVTDNDESNRKMEGLLGVQVHVGPPMKVEYRNIRLKKLN